MNRYFYTIALFSCLLLIAILSYSCRKFIEVPSPETKAELSTIFASDQTANSAVTGLYYRMTALTGGFCTGAITLYGGLSADEINNVTSNSNYDAFKNNALLSNNTTIRNFFWTDPYRNIYQANAVIEGLEASSNLSPGVKAKLQGEMLFTRALHYFYLINLFGAVPYQTATNYEINAVMPRTDANKVYDQISADLIKARALLENVSVVNNQRPNKDAVTALLARVYLYQSDWQNAAEMATEVINSGRYILADPANVFLAISRETIFQLSKQMANSPNAGFFVPAAANVRPTFSVTENLVQSFESGDKRKANWLKSNTVSGTIYYYPYKYKNRASSPVTEYEVVQRLAELYLIRAEALNNLNDRNGAIDDIDKIRERAGVATIRSTNPTIDKDALGAAILKECQREYFTEWGHRWMDLKRLGKADEALGAIKGVNWQLMDKLYPVPFSELQLNPFLTQNEGYTN